MVHRFGKRALPPSLKAERAYSERDARRVGYEKLLASLRAAVFITLHLGQLRRWGQRPRDPIGDSLLMRLLP